MRIALAMTVALMSLNPVLGFSAEKCTCTHQCMEKCKKGEGHSCKCKSCDCKKSGKCGDGHCDREEKTT